MVRNHKRVVSIFGIIFLFFFFGGAGEQFGPMNDVAAIVQYVLMLPIALALQPLLQAYGAERSMRVMRLGIAGIACSDPPANLACRGCAAIRRPGCPGDTGILAGPDLVRAQSHAGTVGGHRAREYAAHHIGGTIRRLPLLGVQGGASTFVPLT